MTKACIDTNIWISGILFSGKATDVVSPAFNRKFEVILSKVILEEIERNLLTKFRFGTSNTKRLIRRILQISDLFEPTGSVQIIPNRHTDNLVLETALIGGAKYLVTGDKQHLLPIRLFKNIRIVDAAEFMSRIKK